MKHLELFTLNNILQNQDTGWGKRFAAALSREASWMMQRLAIYPKNVQ